MWSWIQRLFRGWRDGRKGPGGPEQDFGVVDAAPIRDELPTWAVALGDLERLRAFETVLLNELRNRRVSARLLDGMIRPTDPSFDGVVWGLGNIAQACANLERTQWDEFIGKHVDTLIRLAKENRKLQESISRYSEAKTRLVPRLWDEHSTPELRGAAVIREDIPGLLTVLSLDLPDSIRTVSREMLEKWGIDEDQAFAKAFDNLDDLAERKLEAVDLGEGARLMAIEGPSYYTASLALKLAEIPDLMGRHGCFVGLPTRHALLSMPFNEISDIQKLHHLMSMTRAGEVRGPGSLSHRVFWYRPGEHTQHWCEVPFEISQSSVNVVAPKPLVDYLNSINPDEE